MPVPSYWDGFLIDCHSKAVLVNFLPKELIANAPADKSIITTGGLKKCDDVLSNLADIDIDDLKSTHEAADRRIILHCMDAHYDTVVVWSCDTDVLLLLMFHTPMINKEIIMKAGTDKAPKCIPVNDIVISWNFSDDMSLS